MPIYQYKCSQCSDEFEVRRSLTEEYAAEKKPVKCPRCGSEKVSRSLTTFSKGAGCGSESYRPPRRFG